MLETYLYEPLNYEFFRHALWAAVLAGGLCGLMGVYIVLRGLSYIGHGLSHAAFGGAVIGYMIKLNFYFAAVITALGAAIIVDKISDGRRIRADAAIGIVTTAIFALGIAIISLGGNYSRSFEAALFGNILGVSSDDLLLISLSAFFCFSGVFIFYRQLLFIAFDEEAAQVFGINRRRIRLIFATLLALCVIASMNIVGVTMIAATLIIPAASLRMLTNSFHRMIIFAPVLGAVIGVLGLFLSYHLDTASGATIVLTGAAIFFLFWFLRLHRDRYRFHAHAHSHGAMVHVHAHTHDSDHNHPHSNAHASGQE